LLWENKTSSPRCKGYLLKVSLPNNLFFVTGEFKTTIFKFKQSI
jgi:hypothetical protein